MRLTISGYPGSGKTSVGKLLAEKLGYEFLSVGQLRRDRAKQLEVSIQEYNKMGELDPSTDNVVDEHQRKLGKESDNFIFEGRLSFHFIPNSMKIFLTVDSLTGAERILKERRESEKSCTNLEEQIKLNEERIASDKRRYAKYYGINCYDPAHYDLHIDTTPFSPEEVCEIILKETAKYR